ncbi:ABC transporter substrate-binding protein [Thermodesulfobacteriota bacterium]
MRSPKTTLFFLIVGSFIFFMSINLGLAGEVGVTDTTVTLGSIYQVTGIGAQWGIARNESHGALLKYINEKGGIHGRKIIIRHENDNFEPPRSILAFKKLVEVDKVFAFVSGFGGRTMDAVVPLAQKAKIPYLFFSGNSGSYIWPVKRYIFPWMPLYEDFPRVQVDYLANDLKKPNARIAYVYSDSVAGKGAQRGLLHQIKTFYPGMKIVGSEKIQYGALDMSAQVFKLRKEKPDVVMVFCYLTDAAKFAQEMEKVGWKPPHVMLYAGASADVKLIELAGSAVEGAYGQYVFPSVENDMPGVNFYKEVCKKYLPGNKKHPSQPGLLGFIELQLALEALKLAGRNLTRESFVDTLENRFKNVDLQSIAPVTYAPDKHWGLNHTFLTRVQGQKFIKVTGWRAPKGGFVKWPEL